MKFITVQAFPQKQWTDDDGKHHSETCLFTDITVKTRNEIGFAPMWAIPITTFKETLASISSILLVISFGYGTIIAYTPSLRFKNGVDDKLKRFYIAFTVLLINIITIYAATFL